MSKFSIVISGGVSLCTYELGVLLSFYQAYIENREIDFETVSGASAGAISGFIFASALRNGLNPFAFEKSIVESAGIEKLLSKDDSAVLDFGNLKPLFLQILNVEGKCPHSFKDRECLDNRSEKYCGMNACGGVRRSGVMLSIGATSVDSLVYDVEDSANAKKYPLRQHRAVFSLDFGGEGVNYAPEEIFNAICASASYPAAFPLVHMKISKRMLKGISEEYKPDEMILNFTDGGMTDNLPLKPVFDGRRGTERIAVIVPHPEDVKQLIENANRFGGFPAYTTLAEALIRTFNVVMYQSLYADISSFAKVNAEVKRRENLISEMKKVFESLPQDKKDSVGEFLKKAGGTDNDIFLFLRHDKISVPLDIISPSRPEQELSGEILNHFGGFFDERMRKNDFRLGYRNGKDYLRGIGITVSDMGLGREAGGSISFKNMKNKRLIAVVLLKTLISLLFPYRKNVFLMPLFLMLKFALMLFGF